MPYPLPLTRTEAYLAYKAGVIQQSDLKPSLAVPRNGIDAWLAYWTGIAEDYPKREDGTPHILQEEEAYIAYLCGVLDEYPEKCLRRVGAYLRYIISARWGRPDHPLNREELYLSLIKTQFIPSGDPSSDIEIDGTTKAPFVDVKMYGDTFQQSYTGKNLFDFDSWRGASTTIAGVTWTPNADQSVTSEGTSTSTHTGCFFEFRESGDGEDTKLEPGTYYIKAISSNPNIGVYGLYRKSGSTTTLALFSPTASGSTASFTIPDNEQYQRMRFRVVAMGSGLDCSGTTRVILSKDQNFVDAGVFEPYVGGQPSPSPDYPQPIQTVTGLQTVEIQGKNLLRYPYTGGTVGSGLTWTVADDGTIHVVGAIGGGNKSYYLYNRSQSDFDMPEIPAGAYKVFWSITGSGSSPRITIQDANGYHNSNASNEVTIATSAKPTNIYIQFTSSQSGDVDLYIKPMIVPSDQADVYAPYSHQTLPLDLGSIELCKLGTYQDYIWKDGEDWKVHKATKELILDGSEEWRYYNGVLQLYSITDYATSGNTPYCGAFKGNPNVEGIAAVPENCCCFNNVPGGTTPRFYVRYENKFSSAGAISQYLAANPTSLYYALATPTDTVITNQALIDQLNALKRGGAEEGTTYIKVSATDPNLPAKLYVEAPKYE